MTEQNFRALAAKAEKDPRTADFAALRDAYVESEDYKPVKHFSYNKLIGQTNTATDFEDVVRFCERILEGNPMDLEVRMMLEFAYERLEWFEFAGKQHDFIEGMLKALFATGDGRSLDTAWQVVAVAEEYTALSVMGLKMLNQELVQLDDQFFDVLTVRARADDNEEPYQLFFEITTPFMFLQNMME